MAGEGQPSSSIVKSLHMDPGSKRDQKRQSAKKNSERTVYTQKAVRAKEALILKSNGPPGIRKHITGRAG